MLKKIRPDYSAAVLSTWAFSVDIIDIGWLKFFSRFFFKKF